MDENNITFDRNSIKFPYEFKYDNPNEQAQRQVKILQQCGATPQNQYITAYHISFNTIILIGVIILAIILLKRNFGVIRNFYKKHSVKIIFSTLLIVLLTSLYINISFSPYQLKKFRNDLQRQFYYEHFVYTQEYQNYSDCQSNIK